MNTNTKTPPPFETSKIDGEPVAGVVYSMDFKRGNLVPLQNPGLPVGTVIYYEDRANPRRDFVIVGDSHRGGFTSRQFQRAVCLEDGHASDVAYCNGEFSGHWDFAGRTIAEADLPAVLQEAEANGARLKAEADAAAKIEAQNRAQEKSELLAKWGGILEPVAPGKYATAALGSRNLKKQLAKVFPGVKFSVRSDTFSGGDSIDVSWTLGPTTREVCAISDRYQEGSFNGMEDIYESNRDNQWPALFGGAKYVNESRHDGEACTLVAKLLCERYGIALPADGKSFWDVYRPGASGCGDSICSDARKLLFRQSYPAGAVIVGIEETGERCGDDILRVVFKIGDKVCTKDTPEAKAAHFRAKFAEWAPESRAALESLATNTGRDLAGLFYQYDTWQESQFQADHASDRSPEAFAKLPEFSVVSPAVVTPPALKSEKSELAGEPAPTVTLNPEKNGVEIRFPSKPAVAVLDRLKANGWRWSRFSACWYAKQSPEALALAQELAGGTVASEPEAAPQAPRAEQKQPETAPAPSLAELAQRALAQSWAVF